MPVKKFLTAGADLLEEFYGKTPTERLRTASERATYDPEDGGLGLAPGNTSEERMQLMFPTRVFHGGRRKQAESEQLRKALGKQEMMFASDSGQVASSYAPSARDMTDGGNVMPLRIRENDAAVVDFEGRLFSGFPTEYTPSDKVLSDVVVRNPSDQPLLRIRRELSSPSPHSLTDRVYLPHETVEGGEIPNLAYPFSTDGLHQAIAHAMKEQYGVKPSMTRFDNIVDIGRHRHGETSSERFIPSTVYAIRDGSKIRSEFAAFDPLLRKYSGLSLGASATAVGSLLDQLPTDEAKQGALYADSER